MLASREEASKPLPGIEVVEPRAQFPPSPPFWKGSVQLTEEGTISVGRTCLWEECLAHTMPLSNQQGEGYTQSDRPPPRAPETLKSLGKGQVTH